MLSKDLNERLSHTGPDTTMGKLLRMYWHPIAAVVQLDKNPVRRVRVLGEDLTLYRGRDGTYGLVGARCAHRLVDMKFGFPSYDHDNALVCPYHGWTYDKTGQCIRQPAERAEGFKDKVKIPAYPVKAMAGLIFAYLGPEPVPELPAWEPMVMDDTLRYIEYGSVPCNWVQCQENSTDRSHTEWLHGYYAKYSLERRGIGPEDPAYQSTMRFAEFPTDEFKIDPFDYGFVRRHTIRGGEGKDDGTWTIGQPLIFPAMNITSSGTRFTMIWRTPTDDHNTMSWFLHGVYPGEGVKVPVQNKVEAMEIQIYDDEGEVNSHFTAVQDLLAFFSQGPVVDRTQERLGHSDRDVVQWRNSVIEQLNVIERGETPINVFHDPAMGKFIKLPLICKDDPKRFGTYSLTLDQKYQRRSATSNYSTQNPTVLDQMEKFAQMGTEAWLSRHRGKAGADA